MLALYLYFLINHIQFSSVQFRVTEGASRNARMGKTRKEAIEIPKWDPKCHVLKFPVRKTK